MFTTGANAPEVVNQVDRKKPALSGEENLLLLWLNAYRAAPHYPGGQKGDCRSSTTLCTSVRSVMTL
jgi:hypothetical protein